MVIWKTTLVLGKSTRKMPYGATVLHVGVQDGQVTMWFMCDPEATLQERDFNVFGTGHPIDTVNTVFEYLDTVMIDPFVWHIFEEKEN